MLSKIECFLILSLLSFGAFSQNTPKQYSFNGPDNVCYFEYLYYAPNGNYSNVIRPFIFILCDEKETPQIAFQRDTLKRIPQFHDYMFVYIPNNINRSTQEKLLCIEPLVELCTYHFACSRENVFFVIRDPSINSIAYEQYGLNKIFKETRFSISSSDTVSLSESFKETKIVIYKEEELGTFYVEPPKEDKQEAYRDIIKTRTYFGEPSKFDYMLTGTVIDQSTGELLPFATVEVVGTSIRTKTNVDGTFSIPKMPTDTNTLVIKYIGYNPELFFLSPASPERISVRLSGDKYLQTVQVYGFREDIVLSDNEDVSKIKFTPEKLENLPSIGERDIMRSFQLMPGISAANESSSGLYVRGGTPDQNLILYDGFTIYHVDHLYGFFSAFNANAIKEVQLYKGGFESRFGGRLSSITEITGKDGNHKKFNMGADISLLSTNFWMEIPAGEKFTSVITFRRSYQGFIYNTVFDKFNTNEETETQPQGPGPQSAQTDVKSFFYDLNAKATYTFSRKDKISLSLYNGTDKLDNSSSFQAPSFGGSASNFGVSSIDLTRYGNIGMSLKWSRNWTDQIYSNTVISYSNYYSNRDRTQQRTSVNDAGENDTTKTGIIETNDLKDYSLRSDFQWNAANFSKMEAGVFATLYDIAYTYSQNDTTTVLDKNDQGLLAGAYLQNKFKFWDDKVQLTPGVRMNYYNITNEFYFEPRLSLSVKMTKKFSTVASTGKFYQFANRVTREDILSGSKDFWLLSDGESIPVSSSIHYIAGFSYGLEKYLFSVEGFYKTTSDITEYSLRFNPSPDGVSYSENFFTGNGYAKGIEFLAQKRGGKINGWISYTLSEAKNQFDIYSEEYYYSGYNSTHEFKAVAMYSYRRWDFSATWIYATGRPYTAPSGAYSIELLDGTTQDFFTVIDKNSIHLPDYHRMDISANYKLLGGAKGEKRRREIGYLGFSIFNLYDRTNVWYNEYLIESGQIIETNVNYLGITPNITLSLKVR